MNLDRYKYLNLLTSIWMWEILEWLTLWNRGSIRNGVQFGAWLINLNTNVFY